MAQTRWPTLGELRENDERASLLERHGPVFLVVYPWRDKDPQGFDTLILTEEAEQATEITKTAVGGLPAIRQLAPGGGAVAATRDRRAFVFPVKKTERNPFAGLITVGRARNNDLQLMAPGVSKIHAWFVQDKNGAWALVDKGSTNGTLINGKRLAAQQPTPLALGDSIMFGAVQGMFCDVSGVLRLCTPSG